ncbi:MAG: hypothetical protein R3F61_06350 [Myxococcota bacterium]
MQLRQMAKAGQMVGTANSLVEPYIDGLQQLSNSDAIQQIPEMMESGATFLGGLMDGELGLDGLSSPAVSLADLLGAADDDPGHEAVRGTIASEDEGKAEATGTTKAGVRVQNGHLASGFAKEVPLPGGGKMTAGGFVAPTAGALGAEAGVKTARGGANAGFGIDLGTDGPQAMNGSVEADLGSVAFKVSGGVENRVGEVTPTKDGKFEVRWQSGYGFETGGSSNAMLVNASCRIHERWTAAASRTFDTAAEAHAFRAQLGRLDMLDTKADAADARSMDAGEKMTFDVSSSSGLDASSKVGVGGGLGVALNLRRSMEVESLGNGVVKTKMKRDNALGGSGKLTGGVLGLAGRLGGGFGSEGEVDFDLSQPGAAALFETYQETGFLPSTLPAGVTVVQRDTFTENTWGSTWNLPWTAGVDDKATRSGRFQRGDEHGDYDEGRSTFKEAHGVLGLTWDEGSESHITRLERTEDDMRLTSHSEYHGRDAVANAVDDLSPGRSYEGTYQEYGHQAGDIVVDTKFRRDALYDLYRAGWEQKGKSGGQSIDLGAPDMAIDEVQEQPCMELAEQVAEENYPAFAQIAAQGGGECQEMLRRNLYDTTDVKVQHPLVDRAAIQAGLDRLADFDAAQERGALDPQEVSSALVEARIRLAMLEASGLPEELVGTSRANLIESVSRLAKLQNGGR